MVADPQETAPRFGKRIGELLPLIRSPRQDTHAVANEAEPSTGAAMSFEDDLGWEYFGNDPEQSPRMTEHMDWHNASENKNRTGNYGERFLIFHRDYIEKFDQFRLTKGLLPVSAWDPSTPIPANLDHPHVLTQPRATSDPYSTDPACKTPTWATMGGGADVDPLWGYTRLGQFQSLDELGRSVDHGWHGTVHNTIGGDMSTFSSPIDPIFWRWHRWVDNVSRTWELSRKIFDASRFAAVAHILFGIINDAPGVWIGPDGKPHPFPGGPGDPGWRGLPPAERDLLLGVAIREFGNAVSQRQVGEQVSRIGAALIQSGAKQLG